MAHKELFWCGEGDLFSPSPLKTSKLYITRSSKNTRSSRNTQPSHTTSHTGLQSCLKVAKTAGGAHEKEPAE